MSAQAVLWLVIVLLAVGTYVLKAAFLLFATRLTAVPPTAETALRMLPPAVLAALVVPSVLWPDGELQPLGPRALAAVVALLVAWRTRSYLLTLAVGLTAMLLLQLLF